MSFQLHASVWFEVPIPAFGAEIGTVTGWAYIANDGRVEGFELDTWDGGSKFLDYPTQAERAGLDGQLFKRLAEQVEKRYRAQIWDALAAVGNADPNDEHRLRAHELI